MMQGMGSSSCYDILCTELLILNKKLLFVHYNKSTILSLLQRSVHDEDPSNMVATTFVNYLKYVCAAVFSLIELLVMAMSMHKLSYSSSHVQV